MTTRKNKMPTQTPGPIKSGEKLSKTKTDIKRAEKIRSLIGINDDADFINYNLVAKQNVSPAGVRKIRALHQRLRLVMNMMEKEDNIADLRLLAKEVEEIEFGLQAAWKFPLSRESHTWWNRVPKCSCATSAKSRFDISPGCPIHGPDLG
jgi:hypothetical protein